MVAPVEHEHPGPAGQRAREADREPVRVGGRERELPAREAEPARELLPHPERVLARQHERDPAVDALAHRPHGRLRRVAAHRARVAEAEVDVLEPVDVPEAGAARLGRVDGEPAGPAGHPVHRHAAEERPARAPRQLPGAGMLVLEPLQLARVERGDGAQPGPTSVKTAAVGSTIDVPPSTMTVAPVT